MTSSLNLKSSHPSPSLLTSAPSSLALGPSGEQQVQIQAHSELPDFNPSTISLNQSFPTSPASRSTLAFGRAHLGHRKGFSSTSLVPKEMRVLLDDQKRNRSNATVRKPYPSTRLKGEIPKPWMQYKDPAHRWTVALFYILVFLGVAGGAAIIYTSYAAIPSLGKLCLVMDDDFSNGINSDYWTHEVQVGGFGNHEFEWTTSDAQNSYVQDGVLYVVPTLTSDSIGADKVTNGYTLNLTTDGTCTSTDVTQCAVVSNSTTHSIINPVRSARLVTRNKVNIRYGKVEVIARMPLGDWLWPAIWMLPVNATYGEWPRSGEIDIIESRGNNASYNHEGVDHVQSTLHWGPQPTLDSFYRTTETLQNRFQSYNQAFHRYTLEWDAKYLTVYVDNKVLTVFNLDFDKTFWKRGNYPASYQNGSQQVQLTNPWYSSQANAAPFDQAFYLILNVAVGGTNGFFPDNIGGKPWLDSSTTAMSDFWAAKDQWYPTWPTDPTKRGMAVDSVKMWQQC